jgi:hypothetical protein
MGLLKISSFDSSMAVRSTWPGRKRRQVVVQYRLRPLGRGLPGSGDKLNAQPVE